MNHSLLQRLAQKTDTRIFHLVIDGVGGLPHPDTGKTELETANTPNLDRIVSEGCIGLSTPVEPGITPGSGPAHLSLFGYDPVENEIGRGILDISGIGFDFKKGDLAARINFCTVDSDGIITDRRAGRISDEEGKRISARLSDNLALDGIDVHFLHTKEYRAGLVLRHTDGSPFAGNIADTDPQVTGKPPKKAEARDEASRKTASLIDAVVDQAREILADEEQANMILVRGIDSYEPLPSFTELYKLNPYCIAAYPMYRGVARLAGMDLAELPKNATVSDQFDHLEKTWARESPYDYIFFHVKKTDSAGEDGDFDRKVRLLEELDLEIPRLLYTKPDVIVMTGDHSTPATMKSHSWHPLPTCIRGSHVRTDAAKAYSESEAAKGNLGNFKAVEMMPLALAHAGKLLKFGA